MKELLNLVCLSVHTQVWWWAGEDDNGHPWNVHEKMCCFWALSNSCLTSEIPGLRKFLKTEFVILNALPFILRSIFCWCFCSCFSFHEISELHPKEELNPDAVGNHLHETLCAFQKAVVQFIIFLVLGYNTPLRTSATTFGDLLFIQLENAHYLFS